MSRIVVVITTDHQSRGEAIQSVSKGLERAGYMVLDYELATIDGLSLRVPEAHAIITAVEPDVRSNE